MSQEDNAQDHAQEVQEIRSRSASPTPSERGAGIDRVPNFFEEASKSKVHGVHV